MSAPTSVRPSPKLPRVKRIEQLARRAEEIQFRGYTDEPAVPELLALVQEMAREMHRMAHALDGVV